MEQTGGMHHEGDSGTPVRRVAIVGVHGVAHHDPGATADAMAELLLSLPSYQPEPGPASGSGADEKLAGPGRSYDEFRSIGIRVPLAPVRFAPNRSDSAPAGQKSVWQMEETSTVLARRVQAAPAGYASESEEDTGAADDEFTRLLLEKYRGAGDGAAGTNAYITARLEGKRRESKEKKECEVHIYEVLWADLASSNSTLLSFLLALFQLILHLASLSRLAVDATAAECNSRVWRWFRNTQTYAIRVFQIPLPLLKIVLLIALIACIPAANCTLKDAQWIAPLAGALGGIAASFLIGQRRLKEVVGGPWRWSVIVVIPPALGLAAGWALQKYFPGSGLASAIAIWTVAGGAIQYWLLSKYDLVRRGAKTYGWLMFGCGLFAFIINLARAGGDTMQAGFLTCEWLIAALRFSWMLFFLFALCALVLGSIACWTTSDPAARARARAAVRTSRFALALPAFLFVSLTSLLWASFFKIADWAHQPFFTQDVFAWQPVHGWFVEHTLMHYRFIPDPTTFAENPIHGDYLRGVLAWSLGYGAPLSMGVFLIALLLMGWWLLPSVTKEGFVLRSQQVPPRNSTNAATLRLGTWCSRGLDATSVITFLFWVAAIAIPILYIVLPRWPAAQGFAERLKYATEWMVVNWVVVIAGAVIAIVVRYGSQVLGAVLDVDNYLRTEPGDATPRAKIFERYVSTLRYLASYKGADGRGYDEIIVVAHSLGALISADLLRFVMRHNDPSLGPLRLGQENSKVVLMTMGNPTRQLLNRFFPHLYQWVRPMPYNGLKPLPGPASTPPGPQALDSNLPGTAELGVAKWVNVYRSGDYIGRSLWMDEWYSRTASGSGKYPQPIHKIKTGERIEMCIGAGGHTRYWDDTAPDVAEELDDLIARP